MGHKAVLSLLFVGNLNHRLGNFQDDRELPDTFHPTKVRNRPSSRRRHDLQCNLKYDSKKVHGLPGVFCRPCLPCQIVGIGRLRRCCICDCVYIPNGTNTPINYDSAKMINIIGWTSLLYESPNCALSRVAPSSPDGTP